MLICCVGAEGMLHDFVRHLISHLSLASLIRAHIVSCEHLSSIESNANKAYISTTIYVQGLNPQQTVCVISMLFI